MRSLRGLIAFSLTILALATYSSGIYAQPPGSTATATIYLPLLSNEIPRPYLMTENTVSVVQSASYSHWWNRYLTSLMVAGEVANTTDSTITGVVIQQRFCTNMTGEERTEEYNLLLPALPPGEVAPFSYSTGHNTAQGVQPCGMELTNWVTATVEPLPLTVLSQERALIGEYTTRVSGSLRNDSAQALSSATVAVTLYDAKGAILDAKAQPLGGPIQPGATLTYTVEFAAWPEAQIYSGKVAFTRVQAYGVAVP